MVVHVLAGDSLVGEFEKAGIDGEVIVCRECFVDGDSAADSLEELWDLRESFLKAAYGETNKDYRRDVVEEFIRMWNLADGNKVNLWFEYELFCQVNLWFSLWLLRSTEPTFYIVYPGSFDPADKWKNFSQLDGQGLKDAFASKKKLVADDIFLAVRLWEAFAARDFDKLKQLGETETACFPTLKEVTEAACSLESRPEELLRGLISGGKPSFGDVFKEFNNAHPVYGFGDLQVKRIFDGINGA